MSAVPALPLALFVGALSAQRLSELVISKRNIRTLRARGAQEHGRGHYALLIAIHTLFPLALIAEVVWLGARPGPAWPLWLALVLAAQGLRQWAIRSLGDCWNVRIWVVPGATPISRGPYRWLRHPNYLAVVIEMVAAPLVFGAWRTAVTLSALNLAALLLLRIPAEERALGIRR